MRIKSCLLFSAFLTVATTSCGGGSGGGLTTDQFCAQKAERECQVVARCVTADAAACLAKRKSVCLTFAASQTVAPRIFRPANASKCLDKTKELYAKPTAITAGELATMEDFCSYVFQGDVKKEQPCTVKYDCEGTFICDKGLCATRVVKGKGALCGNPGEVCEAGAYCTMVMAVQKCEPKKAAGDSCDGTAPCLETLRCDGTCKERVASGQACTNSDDCIPAASYCDPYVGNICDLGLSFGTGAATCKDYGGTAAAGTGGTTGGTGGKSDSGAGGTGGATTDSGAPEAAAETAAEAAEEAGAD